MTQTPPSSGADVTQPSGPGQDPPDQPELLVITGMSGAGRSTAAQVLEDVGWYVVDNLPPQLIGSLTDLFWSRPGVRRIGVAVDARVLSFLAEVRAAREALHERGVPTRLLFLDASDDVLVQRFESTRRPHPLQAEGRLLDGIIAERELLRSLRASADTVVDTSRLNVHQLANTIRDAFGASDAPAVRLTLLSFGFKYGLPLDADQVADARFLPNPFWVPELRARTGLEEPVSRYVLAQPGAAEFLQHFLAALRTVLDGYARENKRHATVAVGCTGGKHRSVAIVEELARRIAAPGLAVSTVHRDLGRE